MKILAIDAAVLEARSVETVEEFKEWTRTKIRPVFPHEMLCSGYGHFHAGGVVPDYLVTVDAPAGYFEAAIRNRGGHRHADPAPLARAP